MKRIAIICLAFMLGACASQKEFYAMQEKLIDQVKEMKLKEAEVKLEAQRTRTELAKALNSPTSKLDAGGAAAIGVAMALGGGTVAQNSDGGSNDLLKIIALQRPPETWDDKALKWAQVVVPGALSAYKILVDKQVGMAQIDGNTEVQKALYKMIEQINRDTGNAARPSGTPAPTYQITVNGDGNGVLGGTASTDNAQLTLTCSSASGPGGAGATGGAGGTGTATVPAGSGAAGGAGAPSGAAPVTCTVTR